MKPSILGMIVMFVCIWVVSVHAAEPRVVKVGAFNYYPGIFKDTTDGSIKGFYVDALAEIEAKENIRFEYVHGSWSEGLDRIKTGEVDMLTSVAFSPERAEFLDYGKTPLLTVWGELYVPLSSHIDGITSVTGKKIAVMKNDMNARHFIELVQKFGIACEFVEVSDFEEVFRAVKEGKADAGVVNNTTGAAKQREYGLRSSGIVFNPFDIYFAVSKGKNSNLINLLDTYLNNWRHQPTSVFNEARQKWSHGNINAIAVIPEWLKMFIAVSVAVGLVAFAFILLLKNQVRIKTQSVIQSLKENQLLTERQNALLAAIPDIVMEVDINKVYTWANRAGIEFFGEDVIGKEASFYFEGNQNTYEIVQPLFDKSADVLYVETYQRRKDGEVRLLAWWCKSLRNENGKITGLLSTARDITNQKMAERALQESEQTFRKLFEDSADAILLINGEGLFSECNQAALNLMKMSRETFLFRSPLAISPEFQPNGERSDECAIDMINRAYANGHHRFDWTCLNSEGSEFIVEVSLMPIVIKGETFLHTTWRDITERKGIEESLRLTRFSIDAASDSLFWITPDAHLIDVNEAACQALGYTREELLQLRVPDIDIYYDAELWPHHFEELRQLGSMKLESLQRRKNGELLSVEVVANYIKHGEQEFNCAFVRDISERKRMEKALRESEYFFKETQNAARIGSFQSEFYPNDIWKTSPVCDEIFGMDENYNKTVQGWIDLLHPENAQFMIDYVTNDVIGKGIPFDKEYRIIRHTDGATRWVWGRGQTIIDETGRTTGLIGTIQDVTEKKAADVERKHLQNQLHQAQKMEAIGQLAGGIAHDFNNALGAIMGAAELLKSDTFTPAEQQDFLNMILTAGGRAADLTQKLLTFSRKGAKASTAVDCFKIITDTVGLLNHTIDRNIAVHVENNATRTSVIGDDSLLQNAFMNMGINASHAMPNGGKLTFTLKNIELDQDYCALSPFDISPGEYLEISIRDTGFGMSPEIQARIFEPFFTTKEQGKGTGLGLAAVYGTVQEHGGAITVYSEQGTGTVFHLYLPVTSEKVRVQTIAEPIAEGSGTILVIDDEELIRVTASALLASLGYSVLCASNGVEGISIVTDKRNSIDLIILDMIMPVMGGREAFGKLREIDPTIPVIIASGFAKEDDMIELKKQGVDGFLNKPFLKSELAEMVSRSIKRISK